MKSRREIYSEITEEVLRCIHTYHCILPEQLYRLFPEYDRAFVRNVITRLNYKRLLRLDKESGCLVEPLFEGSVDKWMIRALWVMLDQMVDKGSHTAGEYPIKLSFVQEGKLWDVAVAAPGEELLVSLALESRQGENHPALYWWSTPDRLGAWTIRGKPCSARCLPMEK